MELLAILDVIKEWHAYNHEVFEHRVATRYGLFHQLFFDIQMMMVGFTSLLQYIETKHGTLAVRVRALNQDSLESLFGPS